MKKHKWIEKDDLMVLFIHKYGIEKCPLTKQEIADKIGTSLGSVNYRIGNFKAIEGIGNATHYAKLSEYVYKKYYDLSEIELKKLAFMNI